MTGMLPRLATTVTTSRDPGVLGTLDLDGVAAALWLRDPDPAFQDWLDALPVDSLPGLRRTLRPRDVAAAVRAACDAAGTPDGPFRDRLVDEVAGLADHAARALSALMIELRLDVRDRQACPKWHLDVVRGRMLCTLRGTGTQFGLGRPEGEPAKVQTIPTGTVALFRGLLWPGQELSGIVHRSPPMTSGEARLVLVIDPVDEAGSC